MKFYFDKLIIFGLGLMGGSFAKSIRLNKNIYGKKKIIGVGKSEYSVKRSLFLNIIDYGILLSNVYDLEKNLKDADLIFLAVPVSQIKSILKIIFLHINNSTIITDVGSTKSDVVMIARNILGNRISQFIPGHPISGKELSGIDSASSDLYFNKNVVLCYLEENNEFYLNRIALIWNILGSKIHVMSPEQHDNIFSSISHLPHILSFAFINHILNFPDFLLKLSFVAGGFKDFTRIAASNSKMWRDICMTNKTILCKDLDLYINLLVKIRLYLKSNNSRMIDFLFNRASKVRNNIKKLYKFLKK